MTHPFLENLREAWNPQDWRDLTVIVGVSGGADSVALLRGLAGLREAGRGRLVIAHFNHGLRGDASHADAEFTRNLCDRLELPLEIGTSVMLPKEIDATSEAAARAERYAFFEQIAKSTGARFVATAHTADDQAETILHRIIRGTGIAGLSGIPRTRILAMGITMLRPLLGFTRHEVMEFLRWLPQSYCEDASNDELRFTRNRIRRNLLPELARDYNPQVRRALCRLGTLAADSQQVIESLCAGLVDHCVTAEGPRQVTIDCTPVAPYPLAVHREVCIVLWKHLDWPLQGMGFDQWNQLASMLSHEPATLQLTLPGNILAERRDKLLRLTRNA